MGDSITLTGATMSSSGGENHRQHDHNGHSHSHSHSHNANLGDKQNEADDNGLDTPPLEDLVNSPPKHVNRALSTLFRFGRYEALQPLLEQLEQAKGREAVGDIFALPDDGGHTLLHWAAKRVDDLRFLQSLVDLLVQLDRSNELLNKASSDNVGMRPLHWACTEGSIPHIALLLKHGADIEAKDSSGCTPLLIAAQYGQVEVVAYLLKKGANASAVDSSFDTALHWAAYKGSIQVCGLLSFHQQLDWSKQDSYGQTPLHLASLRGHTSVVRYILAQIVTSPKNKGILFLKDKNERTPLDLAVHKNRPNVESVLREAMSRVEDPRGHFFKRTLWTSLKDLKSAKSWKTWLGLTGTSDEMDEPMRAPYYYVLMNLAIHFLLFVTVFAPLFTPGKGELWDKTGWLLWNFSLTFCSWFTFYKTVKTSPGYLDDTHKHISYWRRLYEETLEAYADEEQAEKLHKTTVSCCSCVCNFFDVIDVIFPLENEFPDTF